MPMRSLPIALVLAAVTAGGAALAQNAAPNEPLTQNRVRTESFRAPIGTGQPLPPAGTAASDEAPKRRLGAPLPRAGAAAPEILTDLSQLPAPVARTRSRILDAARSGDLNKLLTVMQMNETPPVFSFGKERDPVAFWKAAYPDSQGLEVLAILITILETGYVHVDKGTPQEMYMWPYFARLPIKTLTSEQKVELFRIITGADYKHMQASGAYVFYRLGIAPDGVWHFFVTGN
jgi:hypothetical protein